MCGPVYASVACAASVLSPRAAHVPDTGGHMGPRSWFLMYVVVVLVVLVAVGGGVAYFLYSRQKEKERKRFY